MRTGSLRNTAALKPSRWTNKLSEIPYGLKQIIIMIAHYLYVQRVQMKWIAIEGTDGSGKNTIAERIKELYISKGSSVEIFIHPSERFAGKCMKSCLQGNGVKYHLSVFFFILDLLTSLSKIKRCKADIVIFIRYAMSAAYLPPRLVKPCYRFLTRLFPTPDELLFVDIDPKTAMNRIHMRNEEWEMFETEESISDIRKKMISISEGWDIVDNSLDLETTYRQLEKLVDAWNLKKIC